LIAVSLDSYKGIIIKDMSLLADTEAEFEVQLSENLAHWQSEGARSIQIQFRPPKCHLMNVAAAHGFYFHHA